MNNALCAYPLITLDPYFSYWSFSSNLNASNVKHWTGKEKKIIGNILIDGETFTFLGKGKNLIKQIKRIVTPSFTIYTFKNEKVELEVKFYAPSLLSNLKYLSLPVSYFDFNVKVLDNKKHNLKINIIFDEAFTYNLKKDALIVGDRINHPNLDIAYLGKDKQPLLEASGDNLRINWGYLLVSCFKNDGKTSFVDENRKSLLIELDINNNNHPFCMVAYDDIASISYYGDILQGYYKKYFKNIVEAINFAYENHDKIKVELEEFDNKLLLDANSSGGKELEQIVIASYRQSIAAHKLVENKNKELLFISKENFSNGCAATVDITYPSIPLYLLYNPELVLGMCRPVLEYAKMPVWNFDFAPHDTGRYPVITGNVYGLFSKNLENNKCHLPYYLYGKDANKLSIEWQMPVEESGNLLICIFAACEKLKNKEFLINNMPLFDKWVKYLIEFGQDPGNQLCTDDFAGHLAHNTNLAVKSILGIEAYAKMKKMLHEKDSYIKYNNLAKQYAKGWEEKANLKDHTRLVFDSNDGWSLKYNLIWDIYFKSNLFSKKIFSNEVKWYISKINKYGVPLDSRKDYTKVDWEVWVASLTDDLKLRTKLLKPIVYYLNHGKDKCPFSDWYETKNSKVVGFRARAVVGGCFMPILIDKNK